FPVFAWQTAFPRRPRYLGQPPGEVAGRTIAVSDDGRYVASAVSNGMVEGPGGTTVRGDKTIWVWNTRTGKRVGHLTGHSDVVGALAFSVTAACSRAAATTTLRACGTSAPTERLR